MVAEERIQELADELGVSMRRLRALKDELDRVNEPSHVNEQPARSGLRMVKHSELADSNEWKSPRPLVLKLDKRFHFTLDAWAADWNHQFPRYFTKRRSAFTHRWSGNVWANPMYCAGQLEPCVARAREQVLARNCNLVCNLVPGYTADGWWHRQVEAPAGRLVGLDHRIDELGAWNVVRWARLEVAVCKLRGRVTFEHHSGASRYTARHSSVVVVFSRPGVWTRSLHVRS